MDGGIIMAQNVSKDNTRTGFTINKELKRIAEEQALKENRSFSNLLNVALKEYLERKGCL